MSRSQAYVLAAMTSAATTSLHAQTSSVTISGGSVVGNAQLEIRDGEYPLNAMLDNEQGQVKVAFAVDKDGHATNIQVVSSSTWRLLDLQAARLATSKWTFKPADPGG